MGKLVIEKIAMPQRENQVRTIRIYLPGEYEQCPAKRYPVLYMHDGQNMVDPAPFSGYSWDVQNILQRMEKTQEIGGIIVVGIDTDDANRIPEYTQAIDPHAKREIRRLVPGPLLEPAADAYCHFLMDTLKPHIDENYRTLPDREHTGTFGSSCGGNIAIFLGIEFNDVFGIVGAFSPAYWIVKDDLFRRIGAKTFQKPTKIYHDMGLWESAFPLFPYLRDDRKFHRLLLNAGLPPTDLKRVMDPTGRHTELFWQSRLPDFLRFAFAK